MSEDKSPPSKIIFHVPKDKLKESDDPMFYEYNGVKIDKDFTEFEEGQEYLFAGIDEDNMVLLKDPKTGRGFFVHVEWTNIKK